MKKTKILLVALFMGFTMHTFAQGQSFDFGLRIGPNFDWFKPDSKEFVNDGTNMGFTWGFIADYFFADNYAVSTGFNLHSFRGKLEFADVHLSSSDTVVGVMNRKYKIQYLELPVMVKFKTNEISSFKFFGQIGAGLGFNIGAKADETFTYNDGIATSTDEKVDMKDYTSLMRTALIVGLGTEYTIDDKTSILAGINFNNGFSNSLSGKNSHVNKDFDATNNMLEVYVGVMF